jgi:hypothetical protein
LQSRTGEIGNDALQACTDGLRTRFTRCAAEDDSNASNDEATEWTCHTGEVSLIW